MGDANSQEKLLKDIFSKVMLADITPHVLDTWAYLEGKERDPYIRLRMKP